MRQKALCTAMALLVFVASAKAQVGTWEEIQHLAVGTPILIQDAERRVRCSFQRATDDTLYCQYMLDSRFFGTSRNMTFDRGSIIQIRREYYVESNGAVGAAVGGGIGAALGAGSPNARVRGAFALGLLGSAIGWSVAKSRPVRKSTVVYER